MCTKLELTLCDVCAASMIAMIVVGCVLLPAIAFWEIKFAKRPVLARRYLTNRTVVIAAWIGFIDFVRPALSARCAPALRV